MDGDFDMPSGEEMMNEDEIIDFADENPTMKVSDEKERAVRLKKKLIKEGGDVRLPRSAMRSKESERAVTREEGMALTKELGCLFVECSAKTRINVEKCFEELASKILEVPSLLEGSSTGGKNIVKPKQVYNPPSSTGCCS